VVGAWGLPLVVIEEREGLVQSGAKQSSGSWGTACFLHSSCLHRQRRSPTGSLHSEELGKVAETEAAVAAEGAGHGRSGASPPESYW
jgi:hypothetical protein